MLMPPECKVIQSLANKLHQLLYLNIKHSLSTFFKSHAETYLLPLMFEYKAVVTQAHYTTIYN